MTSDDAKCKLRLEYRQLLESYGALETPQPASVRQEAREAMAQAGWFEDWGGEVNTPCYQEMEEASKYVSTAYNPMLDRMSLIIEEDIRKSGRALPFPVYAGGFPVGQVNACVQPATTVDGALILYNHGLIQLLYQIGKVFLLSYDWIVARLTNKDDVEVVTFKDGLPNSVPTLCNTLNWEPVGWTRGQTIDAVAAILTSYVRDGTVTTSPRQQLPRGPRAMTLIEIVYCAELFVLAHEYAHVLLGHCKADEIGALNTPVGPLDIFRLSREQELAADELAIEIMLDSECRLDGVKLADFGIKRIACGIALFFVSSTLKDLALAGPLVFLPQHSYFDTHPPPVARLIRVLELIHAKYGRDVTQLARVCMGWQLAIREELTQSLYDLLSGRPTNHRRAELTRKRRQRRRTLDKIQRRRKK